MLSTTLLEKLKKTSTIEDTDYLTSSKFFTTKDMIQTPIPMLNVALSGRIDGGLTPGLTTIAGPSRHFKSAFALILAGAYLNANPDAVLLFYDSEFGTPDSYFDNFNVDKTRVIHTPITDVEKLKFDIIAQLNAIERGDKVMILVDSIGNLASKKEVEDAENQKSVADMSRAKALKGLFRMVTPHLTIKDIPMVVINHTYKEIGLYPKDVVSGGTGVFYSSDNIWIVGRQQDKIDKDLKGYNFIINVEKSRYVREKSKIPINVTFEGGVNKWSGFVDLAMEMGYIGKPSPGWYQLKKDDEYDGPKLRIADIERSDEFWNNVLDNSDIAEKIKEQFTL